MQFSSVPCSPYLNSFNFHSLAFSSSTWAHYSMNAHSFLMLIIITTVSSVRTQITLKPCSIFSSVAGTAVPVHLLSARSGNGTWLSTSVCSECCFRLVLKPCLSATSRTLTLQKLKKRGSHYLLSFPWQLCIFQGFFCLAFLALSEFPSAQSFIAALGWHFSKYQSYFFFFSFMGDNNLSGKKTAEHLSTPTTKLQQTVLIWTL